jgi:hypothetical protein
MGIRQAKSRQRKSLTSVNRIKEMSANISKERRLEIVRRAAAARWAKEGMRLPLEERFRQKVKRKSKCWIWTGAKDRHGYGMIRIAKPGRVVLAHRISYEIAYGPILPGFCVCHCCDNPACVRPDHLWLGSAYDNYQDAVDKGRIARGVFKPIALKKPA